MDITIRKAELNDIPSLTSLIRSLGLFAYLDNESAQATSERITRHLSLCLADDSHSVYVAELAGGEIDGYISVHWLPYLILPGSEGYVSELFISEQSRGLGIGAQLLNVAESEAGERGCARLMLLNMRQRESYQRGFYAKNGWQERPDAANFIKKLT